MRYITCLFGILLLTCACKKSSSSSSDPGTNPDLVAAAKVVGTFQMSSATGPSGQIDVFTPQNSPGTITVTKTDNTHFHMVLTESINGTTSTSSNDFVFTDVTGDGYVHYNQEDGKATARYDDSVGGLTIDITAPTASILVFLRNP